MKKPFFTFLQIWEPDVTETPELGQAQIPSHPGMKYPVRASPHFDIPPVFR